MQECRPGAASSGKTIDYGFTRRVNDNFVCCMNSVWIRGSVPPFAQPSVSVAKHNNSAIGHLRQPHFEVTHPIDASLMGHTGRTRPQLPHYEEANVSLLTEALFPAELLLLHASPVYYGLGVSCGDGSAVVLIPGLLAPDFYLAPMHYWLSRIGYQPYFAGITCNAECPNLLIEQCLNETIERAIAETGKRVHLIGHSLGGIMARSIAAQRPSQVASVITLGAPFRRTVAHGSVLRIVETLRNRILGEHRGEVLPNCYTARCTCDFVNSLWRSLPAAVLESAIYTKQDGILDWRCCLTSDSDSNFEVTGTHIGLVYNPSVYSVIAARLIQAGTSDR